MTPLADVMFQLLVFFMLSSNVMPYALLTVRSGGIETDGKEPDDSTLHSAPTAAATTAVWTLAADGITASGQRFGLDRLPDLAAALGAQQTRNLLLIIRPGVDIQTVVTVLEQLAARGITSVQIADGGRG